MTGGKNINLAGKSVNKIQTPDEEMRLIMEKGGPLITEPFVLGRNFAGTELVIPPMQHDETLIRFCAGKQKSFSALAGAAAKSFAHRHGPGIDVKDCMPCNTLDGKRRPPIPLDQRAHTSIFIDSMIVSSSTSSKTNIIDFYRCFVLTDSGSPVAEQRISMKPLRANVGTRKFNWLVKTANVPDKLMCFLHTVYRFGKVWDDRPTTFAKEAETILWVEMISSFDLDAADILKAVTLVKKQEFTIYEMDFTIDIAGTLDPEAFAWAAKKNGHKVVESSSCGRNCVKVTPGADIATFISLTTVSRYQLKAYNKILETMQQGTVRSNGLPCCKFEKMVNPSTLGLKKITYEDNYNLHGITRLENTVYFSDNTVPLWIEMARLMEFGKHLLNDALVSCPHSDHIDMTGAYAQTSIAFYWHYIFDLKRMKWLTTHQGNRQAVSEELKTSNPDGLLIRSINSDTGKMNGVVVNGIHGTVKPDRSAWPQMLATLAACCTSGTGPVVYFGVTGGQTHLGQPGPKNMYFRAIPFNRFCTGPNMNLVTHFLANYDLPNECNFESMNVDVDSLTYLKPCVTKHAHLRTQDIQIDISIDDNSELSKLEDLISEGTEAISKFQGGIRLAKEEYLPAEFKLVKETQIRGIGRYKTERVVINYEGRWLWVPKNHHESLKEYANDPKYTVFVRWGEHGFEAKIQAQEDHAGTDICSNPTGPGGTANLTDMTREKFLGKPSAMGNIPVGQHKITGVGFRKHCTSQDMMCYIHIDLHDSQNYFNLPNSLTQQILLKRKFLGAEITQHDIDIRFDFLDQCFLLRKAEGLIRVSGQRNAEPPVSITDSNGTDIYQQHETAKSAKKRTIESIEV